MLLCDRISGQTKSPCHIELRKYFQYVRIAQTLIRACLFNMNAALSGCNANLSESLAENYYFGFMLAASKCAEQSQNTSCRPDVWQSDTFNVFL